jgi:hypothetical protein
MARVFQVCELNGVMEEASSRLNERMYCPMDLCQEERAGAKNHFELFFKREKELNMCQNTDEINKPDWGDGCDWERNAMVRTSTVGGTDEMKRKCDEIDEIRDETVKVRTVSHYLTVHNSLYVFIMI